MLHGAVLLVYALNTLNRIGSKWKWKWKQRESMTITQQACNLRLAAISHQSIEFFFRTDFGCWIFSRSKSSLIFFLWIHQNSIRRIVIKEENKLYQYIDNNNNTYSLHTNRGETTNCNRKAASCKYNVVNSALTVFGCPICCGEYDYHWLFNSVVKYVLLLLVTLSPWYFWYDKQHCLWTLIS